MNKLIIGIICGLLVACGKTPAPQHNEVLPSASVPTPAPAVSEASAAAPALPTLELKVASVGNQMTFDVKSLTAAPGQQVHLVFKNNSTMTTMGHNWVLVRPGTEASVAARGLKRGEAAGYIDVTDHNMLAFTPMAKAGETVEVTFNAPEDPGTYPYICSFPGHYVMMHGVFTVK